MASSPTAMPENRFHLRSISMPSQSHPITLKIKEELEKIKNWSAISESAISPLKASMICAGLASLGELHNYVQDLLHMPLTQQVIGHHQHEKWVDEMLNVSIRLLDVCGTARDSLLMMKEYAQDLQSTLRRRNGGEMSMEKTVGAYICFRKKVKKYISKLLRACNKMDDKYASSPLLDEDYHLSMVIRVLREVRVVTISVFRSLFSFISMQCEKPKSGRRSLVSKLLLQSQVACEGEQENTSEVVNADLALHALCGHIASKDDEVQKVNKAQNGLKALEVGIEGLEAGLVCIFRHLIQTRVNLLNIITH